MRDLNSADPNQERNLTREQTGQAGALDEAQAGILGNDAAAYGATEEDERGEETQELTGFDAPARLAQVGSGAELAAIPRSDEGEDPPLSSEPNHPEDLLPDKVEQGASAPEADERELTARPRQDERPFITPDLLPEG